MNFFLLKIINNFPYRCGKGRYFILRLSNERLSTELKENLTGRNVSEIKVLVLQEDKISL